MSTSAPKQSLHRAIGLIFALQGRSFEGIRLRQLAELVEQSPSTTLRDLEALADTGVAERSPADKDLWRLSPKLIQLAFAHQAELAAVQQRLDDTAQRYSRTT